MDPRARSGLVMVASIVLCFGVAGVGSVATSRSVSTWYVALAKPSWTPPGWLFGPVWSALYLMMGVAAWLVWRRAGFSGARLALGLFAAQLVLNAAWSWLFFGFRMPGLAFGELIVLWCAIVATLAAFWRTTAPAGLLMLPYLLWTSFAACLNFAIWRLNP